MDVQYWDYHACALRMGENLQRRIFVFQNEWSDCITTEVGINVLVWSKYVPYTKKTACKKFEKRCRQGHLEARSTNRDHSSTSSQESIVHWPYLTDCGPQMVRRLFIVVVILVTLSVLKPFQELLGRLADLLAGGEIDVFLAGLGSPILDDLFGDEVFLIEGQQNRWDLGNEVGMFFADEAFRATQECFFVAIGSNHLNQSVKVRGLSMLGFTDLLEHGTTLRDLFDNVVIEDGLSQDG